MVFYEQNVLSLESCENWRVQFSLAQFFKISPRYCFRWGHVCYNKSGSTYFLSFYLGYCRITTKIDESSFLFELLCEEIHGANSFHISF